MAANIITLARVLLVFVAVFLFEGGFAARLAGFILTIIIIYMDALDGYVARKLGVASELGALLDITGDRIVENVYWIYFAAIGMVPFWVPMIVLARGFVTDLVRSVALADGRTPFGDKTMMRSRIGAFVVSSRFSRGLYGVSKALIFCYLGALLVLRAAGQASLLTLPASLMIMLNFAGQIIVYIVLAMCLVRAVPVLVEGRHYLLDKRYSATAREDV